ncbi:hypothetical protein [Bradyrhizobium sp. LMTR 3]|uniref:hypothetical protein n=1 Tax=Bradyrhizobium sp. LMTR 3 TaxID=189873 RepID=UPI000810C75B|nr:hypothetical protein [Bradyrhizobium sp. LMTR 3]OCK53604.1 hypothetical protein LMTR3_28315 [Bradyrhizobium sp. LMTR 3]
MIGITLSSEQVRAAPADVRQWIEAQVTSSLGLPSRAAKVEPRQDHLASCSADEVATILNEIQGVLPAANVFFEFGRQGIAIPQSRVEAFRLIDIAHHTRLQNVGQVIACLDIINEALVRIRGDDRATFCGFDREGHCFVAVETQQNILRLWQSVVARQQLGAKEQAGAPAPQPAVGGPSALDPEMKQAPADLVAAN